MPPAIPVCFSALAVTVDTVAPNAPAITSEAIVNTNEVTLAGTAEANSTITVFDGATELGTALADASGTWSYTTGHLSNGAHAFIATDTDAAGNISVGLAGGRSDNWHGAAGGAQDRLILA